MGGGLGALINKHLLSSNAGTPLESYSWAPEEGDAGIPWGAWRLQGLDGQGQPRDCHFLSPLGIIFLFLVYTKTQEDINKVILIKVLRGV